MALIKSGATDALATVDTTSKALRVAPYRLAGDACGTRRTFTAHSTAKILASGSVSANHLLATLVCGPNKIVRLVRARVRATVATTALFWGIGLFYRQVGGQHPQIPISVAANLSALVPVGMDSTGGHADANAYVTTSTAVSASVVGVGAEALIIASQQRFVCLTAVASHLRSGKDHFDFDFRHCGKSEQPTLRGWPQAFELSTLDASTNAPTIMVSFTWSEDDS